MYVVSHHAAAVDSQAYVYADSRMAHRYIPALRNTAHMTCGATYSVSLKNEDIFVADAS